MARQRVILREMKIDEWVAPPSEYTVTVARVQGLVSYKGRERAFHFTICTGSDLSSFRHALSCALKEAEMRIRSGH